MQHRLAQIDSINKSVSLIPIPRPDGNLPYDALDSVNAGTDMFAFARSTPTESDQIYTARLNLVTNTVGPAMAVTNFEHHIDLSSQIAATAVAWTSPDRRFVVHGLLLRPATQGETGLLPTIMYVQGGPSMVRTSFGLFGYQDLVVPTLAASGYAVLVPNTRGRAGYSDAFMHGIRDAQSYLSLPFEDAVSGIDFLIGQKIADPSRLGVAGLSYGGFLTGYTIDHTDKFKAAVIDEGGELDRLANTGPMPAENWIGLLLNDMLGAGHPLDRAQRATLLDDSIAVHPDRIHTPTLLEFGAHSLACDTGRPLFAWLRAYRVPSVFFVYDEAHGFARPAAVADSMDRTIDWMDHWIRGYPYPADRAKDYAAYGPIPTPCPYPTYGQTKRQ